MKNNKSFKILGWAGCILAFVFMMVCTSNYQIYIDDSSYYSISKTAYKTEFASAALSEDGYSYYIYTNDDDMNTFYIQEGFFDYFTKANFETNVKSGDVIDLYYIEYTYIENDVTIADCLLFGLSSQGIDYMDTEACNNAVNEYLVSTKTSVIVFLVLSIVVMTCGITLLVVQNNFRKKETLFKKTRRDRYIESPLTFSAFSYYLTINSLNSKYYMRNEQEDPSQYEDESTLKYFKMCYYKKSNAFYSHNERIINLAQSGNYELASIVNECAGKNLASTTKIANMRLSSVYEPSYWLGIKNEEGKVIGVLVGTYDKEVGEGTIEWLQIDTDYRELGYEETLVQEFIMIANQKCDFITVCGNINRLPNYLDVYRKCGFDEHMNWYITIKKNERYEEK